MSTIKAPLTEEQVKRLNEYQQCGLFHPFTCCSHNGCKRDESNNWGLLIATKDGWVCPCGKWKQDWAHSFMAEELPQEFKDFQEHMRWLKNEE